MEEDELSDEELPPEEEEPPPVEEEDEPEEDIAILDPPPPAFPPPPVAGELTGETAGVLITILEGQILFHSIFPLIALVKKLLILHLNHK